uniref:MD-2-related lipid-recognition domain-containing protein n=1 Tax=Timema tahoe TaxID=61484 RepID=A0A7R9FJU9_9NEOP|nr:unnamed protein product [Timema tahoe]
MLCSFTHVSVGVEAQRQARLVWFAGDEDAEVRFQAGCINGVSASSLSSRAYWASTTDIPFIGMDTDACEYTNCVTVAGQQQTYSFNLQIPSRKVQTMVYDVKWKLWDDNSMECCFLIKIHITK